MAVTPMPAAPVPAVRPAGELTLDALEVGRRSVQMPGAPQERYQREQRDPHGPEHAVRAGGRPDDAADHERDERATALLEEPAPELAPPPGELGLQLRLCRR